MSVPTKIALEAGKEYYYCTCGKGKDGIFCNGSYKGSSFAPEAFSVEESKDYFLCPCQKSGNGAFCDGSHTK